VQVYRDMEKRLVRQLCFETIKILWLVGTYQTN
jgi:hypothetical protein